MAIDPKQLAFMRNVVSTSFMSDTVVIYNVALVNDAFGRSTRTRTLHSTVYGQLSSPSGSERELLSTLVNAGSENTETLRLLLPYGTLVTVQQEVGTADGTFWSIAHVSRMTLTAATVVLLSRKVVNNVEQL